jgi:hypothetical protein
MAHQYRTISVTVPPGTTQAAPQITPLVFGPFTVVSVFVRVPPGPLGQVGFRIATSGQQWVPWNQGAWIVPNNESRDYPADGWPNTGAWQIVAYNTGVFAHTLEFTWALDPVPLTVGPVVTVTAADLSTLPVSSVQPAANGTVVLTDAPPPDFDVSAPLP